MSKYIDADKFYAKVVSGDPFLFDHSVENELKFMIEQEPSADVDLEAHAHWTFHIDRDRGHWNACSNCHKTISYIHGFPYCPWCGAKMDEATDETDSNS